VAHGLGKLIFAVRVLELIPKKNLKIFLKKTAGFMIFGRRTATDTWEACARS
jgi:hypothetical protein